MSNDDYYYYYYHLTFYLNFSNEEMNWNYYYIFLSFMKLYTLKQPVRNQFY